MVTKVIKGNKVNTSLRKNLVHIWSECFGDSNDYIEMFLDNFLPHISLTTCCSDDLAIGVFYKIPLMTSRGKCCEYLYAAGILEKYRNQGLFYDIVECTRQDNPDTDYFLLSKESLTSWYSNNFFPYIYNCKMVTLSADKLCKPSGDTSSPNIMPSSFLIDEFMDLRNIYVQKYAHEYIIYPQWFYENLKIEKSFCEDVFELITIDNNKYYIIGHFACHCLIIEETNIPSCDFNRLANSLLSYYDVNNIEIKIPLSDSLSGSGVQIIYSGQGTINTNDLWAPFTIE